MASVLERDTGEKPGTALLCALGQGPVLPVVEQYIHIRPVQAVAEGFQADLDIQGNRDASCAHDAQQNRQVMIAAAA